MRNILLCLVGMLLSILSCHASEVDETLVRRLDSCIERRPQYAAKKEEAIQHVKKSLPYLRGQQRLEVLDKLYMEYYTYQFDSAMHYARQEADLARQLNNEKALHKAQRHLALLFAIGGYYSEAENLLSATPVDTNDPEAIYDHYITQYWTYTYWSDYCRDDLFSPTYNKKKLESLKIALKYYPNKSDAYYQYLTAEDLFYSKQDIKGSMKHYMKALKMLKVNTRTYASAAYCIARNYLLMNKLKDYENWLMRAAISDQVNPLKENLALQDLAMYIFKKDERNAERATKYIYCSMEDAQFYHNRLRMLEISQRLPAIVQVYQQQINTKRRIVTLLTLAISIIALILIISIYYILKQNKLLNHRGAEVRQRNDELTILNDRLKKTDAMRGKYMRLFMDLCATYISKLNNYRKLVTRKVKAHQTDDLLHSATSAKITEQEAATFYTQFDRAFKELYPTFVDDFNSLLLPDKQISLTKEGALPTEMRIYALVRLGVTESAEIATLLFYSPQTIYNYRTAVRKRALRPDSFEEDVQALG